MKREIIMLKKIWWQLELLESVHPEFVHGELEPVACDQHELVGLACVVAQNANAEHLT